MQGIPVRRPTDAGFTLTLLIIVEDMHAMTERTYLSLQLGIIILLSCVDGVAALIQHSQWFQ